MPDINVGQLAEAINDKTDRDMQNVDNTAGADAIVDYQEPNAGNNYTWYRKYKSGWVEQGGEMKNANSSGTALITINMPIEMANTHYTCLLGARYDGTDADKFGQTRQSWTTTSFTVYMTTVAYGTNYQYGWWYVSGKAAN